MDVGPEAFHIEKDGGRALITKYARGLSRRSCLVEDEENREELRKELEQQDAMDGMTILKECCVAVGFP